MFLHVQFYVNKIEFEGWRRIVGYLITNEYGLFRKTLSGYAFREASKYEFVGKHMHKQSVVDMA